jgi:hypothetical protein
MRVTNLNRVLVILALRCVFAILHQFSDGQLGVAGEQAYEIKQFERNKSPWVKEALTS